MCGIAGFVSHNIAEREQTLHKMLEGFAHRGPDMLSGYIEGPAALGCARLSIVDIEGGMQPAVSDDRRVAVVFNGEIFNYRDLRDELIQSGHAFHTNSEIETLLFLYLKHGASFVSMLNGQFAIAIWDGRDDRLLLFRDRMGIRPLFWTLGENGFFFGSENKALFASGLVKAELDLKAVLQTFRTWTVVGDSSAFAGIQQLPPAHFLTFCNGDIAVRRWWDWPFPGDQTPIKLKSDEEYAEAFREQLGNAVKRRRMADVPVASYLSGGVDSSVLATVLSQQMQPDVLQTYSIQFDDPEYDESSGQAKVVEHLGVKSTVYKIGRDDIADAFPQIVWHAETPLFRTAPTPLFYLSKLVHQDGIKVVMTGEGADEILLGYDLFREIKIREFWGKNPESAWRGALFKRLYAYLPQFRNPRYLAMALDFYRPHLQDDGTPHFAMAPRWANGLSLEQFLSPDMRSLSQSYDPISGLDAFLPSGYHNADHIERAQVIECQTLLANYLLSSQGDRMSMSHAVEGRYPFLDHEFIEFAAKLPRGIKLRGLKDKFILRRAFSEQLPESVWNRPKVAYQAPDQRGFFKDGKLPEYVEELLKPERIDDVGLFNSALVTQMLAKGRTSNLARVGTRDNMAFVLVLSTMLLDHIFIRGKIVYKPDVKFNREMRLV